MKYAFIKLKNGYETSFLCEFFMKNEESGYLEMWGEKGMVGYFPLEQIDYCCITEKRSEENAVHR